MRETVTVSHGRPGHYTVIAASPFPGIFSGLLVPVASVTVSPLFLAEVFNVVLPHQGTRVIRFKPLPVPVDAPMTIRIFAFSPSGASQPPVSLSSTTFDVFPTSFNDALHVSVTSVVDYWASSTTVHILFSVTAPASSIYSGAHGVAAVMNLLPRIEFPANVYVPLFGSSLIAITAIRTSLQLDSMVVTFEGGGSEVISSRPSNVTTDSDGSTLQVSVGCTPNSFVTRNVNVLISGGVLDGAVVGPIALTCMRRSITAEPAALSISQQSSSTFFLRCDVPPDADVTVSLAVSRDGCLTLNKSSVFIPARTQPTAKFAVSVTHL